jgi:hypothetical protein
MANLRPKLFHKRVYLTVFLVLDMVNLAWYISHNQVRRLVLKGSKHNISLDLKNNYNKTSTETKL